MSTFINKNGYYDRKLKAHVSTWRDIVRTLVGFVYLYEDSTADIVYFSTVEGTTEIRVHHTTTHQVEDPAIFGGLRLDSLPDPEVDPAPINIDPFGKG